MSWLSRTVPPGHPHATAVEHLQDSALLLQGGCLAEYVWITRNATLEANPGAALRSKTRVLPRVPTTCAECPSWSADGLSTNQADDEGGRLTYLQEIVLLPVRLVRDPFRGAPNVIVLCEACFPPQQGAQTGQGQGLVQGQTQVQPSGPAGITAAPISNTRRKALMTGQAAGGDWLDTMWMAFEQELVLLGDDWTRRQPLGWPSSTTQPSSKPSLNYCGIGAEAVGREVLEAIQAACLYAGLTVTGSNLEVLSGALEIQVGPSPCLVAADDLWLARYIITRLAGEVFGLRVAFAPKPVEEDEGLGLHVNVSTARMRGEVSGGNGGGAVGSPPQLVFGVQALSGPLGPSQLLRREGTMPQPGAESGPEQAPPLQQLTQPAFTPPQQAAHEAAAQGKDPKDDTRQELLPGPPGQVPPAAATATSPPLPSGTTTGTTTCEASGVGGGGSTPKHMRTSSVGGGTSTSTSRLAGITDGHGSSVPTLVPPAWNAVLDVIARLVTAHDRHIAVYGTGNEARLLGQEEYSSLERCTWGVGDRAASIRVPFTTARGSGLAYIEDRRPAANADPYLIAEAYLRTLGVEKGPSLEEARRLLVSARTESWAAAQAMAAHPSPSPPEVLSPEPESPRRPAGNGGGGGGEAPQPPYFYLPYGMGPFEFLHVPTATRGGRGGGGTGEGGSEAAAGGGGGTAAPPASLPRAYHTPPPFPTAYMMASWPIHAPAPYYGGGLPFPSYEGAGGGAAGPGLPQSPGEPSAQKKQGGSAGGVSAPPSGGPPFGWQAAHHPSGLPVFYGPPPPLRLRQAGAWMAHAAPWSPQVVGKPTEAGEDSGSATN